MHSDPTFLMTAEVRWFFDGNSPNQVQQWFEQMSSGDQPEERTDYYFVYPQTTTCGVKSRDGQLEVKALVKKLSLINFLPTLKGNIEIWEKVSIGNYSAETNGVDQETKFMRVEKKRWRCMWQWSYDNLYRTSLDKKIMAGCQFELSAINIQEQLFWSLGFESFSPTDNAVMILENTISLVGQFENLLELDEQHLFKNSREASYPEFLHSLVMSREAVQKEI